VAAIIAVHQRFCPHQFESRVKGGGHRLIPVADGGKPKVRCVRFPERLGPETFCYLHFVLTGTDQWYIVYTNYRSEPDMEKQMIVRIDTELKERLSRLARNEGKTTSQMVRELIRDYVKERDIGAYVDELWRRIGAKLTSRGVRPADVSKAVAETRSKRG